MITKQLITDAYVFLRTNNNSIPDEVLDFIKDASFEKLERSINNMQTENKLNITAGEWTYAPTGEVMQGYSQPFAIAELGKANLLKQRDELREALDYLLGSYKADFKTITGAELNNTEAVKKAKTALQSTKQQ